MSEEKDKPLEELLPIFSIGRNVAEPTSGGAPNNSAVRNMVNDVVSEIPDVPDPEKYGAIGAVAGAVSRTDLIRQFFSILVSQGMEPSAAANIAAREVLANEPQLRPVAQPAGATAAQIMEQGKMTSGDKWAKAIGGPGGDTTQQAVENYRMRNQLKPGETLLRSGIALPAGSNVRGATIPAILQQEAAERTAREALASRGASKSRMISNLMANAPGIAGKVLGGVGGAGAGYQGYEAIQALKAAQNNPEKFQAILDMLSAAGSGAAALPIPGAQIPGLAMGLGIPAAGYVGRKIANVMPEFGISKEAGRAAAADTYIPPRPR